MKVHLYPCELALAHVFRTAYAERFTQKTLLVGLEQDGLVGYGEATENHFYGSTTLGMVQEIEAIASELEAVQDFEPSALYDRYAQRLSAFALCALDEAWHDLYGKKQGLSLLDLWEIKPKNILSSYTIGLDEIAVMQAKVLEKPWPIYKIKMSGGKQDLLILRALRKVTEATFRVDANGSWALEEAIVKSQQLADLGVELIEQPLGVEALGDMAKLRKKSPIPLFADESVCTLMDLNQLGDSFDGVNLKLTKCGGITPVKRLIAKARAQDLSIMMGCMVESSVGISALGTLLPWVDYVDMDGALLLKNDPASGIQVHAKGVVYPRGAGTGAQYTHA